MYVNNIFRHIMRVVHVHQHIHQHHADNTCRYKGEQLMSTIHARQQMHQYHANNTFSHILFISTCSPADASLSCKQYIFTYTLHIDLFTSLLAYTLRIDLFASRCINIMRTIYVNTLVMNNSCQHICNLYADMYIAKET